MKCTVLLLNESDTIPLRTVVVIFHTVVTLPLKTRTAVPTCVILHAPNPLKFFSYSKFVLFQEAQISGLVSATVAVRGCFVGIKQVLCCPGPIGIKASLTIMEIKTVS